MPYIDLPKIWFPKFLTYGNYGGPGWSCGAIIHNREEKDWDVEPSDTMDVLFYDHDYVYHIAKTKEELQKGDQILIDGLRKLDPNPRNWSIPPTRNSIWWARIYRHAAILVFRSKLWLGL